MNIYLVQQKYQGYGTYYDSMVVIANNEIDAYHLCAIRAGQYEMSYQEGYTTKTPIFRNYYNLIDEHLWASIDQMEITLIGTSELAEAMVCVSLESE